jgi:hypothetical protein
MSSRKPAQDINRKIIGLYIFDIVEERLDLRLFNDLKEFNFNSKNLKILYLPYNFRFIYPKFEDNFNKIKNFDCFLLNPLQSLDIFSVKGVVSDYFKKCEGIPNIYVDTLMNAGFDRKDLNIPEVLVKMYCSIKNQKYKDSMRKEFEFNPNCFKSKIVFDFFNLIDSVSDEGEMNYIVSNNDFYYEKDFEEKKKQYNYLKFLIKTFLEENEDFTDYFNPTDDGFDMDLKEFLVSDEFRHNVF